MRKPNSQGEPKTVFKKEFWVKSMAHSTSWSQQIRYEDKIYSEQMRCP